MRIFVHVPREDWICDRIGNEFSQHSTHQVSFTDLNADVIWLLAPWCWRQIPLQAYVGRRVICTIHHEVPEKFDSARRSEFLERDRYVTAYHVPCHTTAKFVAGLTQKPIIMMPFWVNTDVWKPQDKQEAKASLHLMPEKFLIGSFQRDTEGSDLITPKWEKGPDRFCDYVIRASRERDVHVLLGAWRRQYVISRLSAAGIGYSYMELPSVETVRTMYAALDLYVVASRHEGGPQALFEAAAMRVPIVSSDVGFARYLLSPNCVIDVERDTVLDVPQADIDFAHERVMEYSIDRHVEWFDRILVSR